MIVDNADIRRCIVELKCPFCVERCETQDQLQQHLAEKQHCKVSPDSQFFKDPQYLFPTYENDALLTAFDIGEGGMTATIDPQEQEHIKKAQQEWSVRREQLGRELERMGLGKEDLAQLPWGNTPIKSARPSPASTPNKSAQATPTKAQ